MSIIYNIDTEVLKETNVNLQDVYVKFMAIPKDKNARMVLDNSMVITFAIQNKIPVFMVDDENEKTVATGIINVNEYIKKKVVKKITEESYDQRIIEEYKNLPIDTVAYTTSQDIDLIEKTILSFLETLNSAELS